MKNQTQMTSKQLKLQVQQLKAKAEAILKASEEREKRRALPIGERIKHFLTDIFTCADTLEIWLPYHANEDYLVSNKGNIKSIKYGKEKLLTPYMCGQYLAVSVWENNIRKVGKVHKMVAETFLEKTDPTHHVHHLDENKLNNELENLTFVTSRENKCASRSGALSEFIGVYWSKDKRKWRAQIHFEGIQKHLGYFEDEIEAAKAYKQFLIDNNIQNRFVTV